MTLWLIMLRYRIKIVFAVHEDDEAGICVVKKNDVVQEDIFTTKAEHRGDYNKS